MGRNNQQRRAEKKRRAKRDGRDRRGGQSYSGGQSYGGRFGPDVDRWMLEMAVVAGARAARSGDEQETEEVVASLLRSSSAMPEGMVTTVVGDTIASVLAGLWDGGWQPVEVARQVRRRRRDDHAAVVASAMSSAGCWSDAEGAAMPDAWGVQLDRLGVGPERRVAGDWLASWVRASGLSRPEGLRLGLEVLGELIDLPAIEVLLPPPSEWAGVSPTAQSASDDPVLAKVRALLAKAESTGFAAEAEALTAKAQELMARHAIDDAVVRASSAGSEVPAIRRIAVDDPYAEAKSSLLRVVCSVNGARCVWYSGFAMMAVVGYRADLDAIEVLFTSLLVQASAAMLEKGSVVDRTGRSRTRSFRQSFLVAFAGRIQERLELAARSARRQAEEGLGASLVPVLAARDAELDCALQRAFPHLRMTSGPAVTNEAGWMAGRVAAELAHLGPRQGMLDGMVAAG